MDYIKEQYRLFKFTKILKKIIKELATNKLSEKNWKDKIKEYFFAKPDFLDDKENKEVFPWAVGKFLDVQKEHGYPMEVLKGSLEGFLDKEINNYIQSAIEHEILIGDNDKPTSFGLSQKSPYVFIMIFFFLLCSLVFKNISFNN